jgi:lysyl-tRNA synthetase class 2
VPISLEQKKSNLERRARILGAARNYFVAQGFLEVETPVRMSAPLPERHIDAVHSEDRYLATSPEPHMKRLLAAGYNRIFQISRCFRKGETGRCHNPEFTMIEWYRSDEGYFSLVDDARGLLAAACNAVYGRDCFVYQGHTVQFGGEWEIMTVDDAFMAFAEWQLDPDPDEFDFDRVMVEKIEPSLGRDRPAVLYSYPAAFSPMAKKRDDDPTRAERLELYIAGLELANGCSENVCADDQLSALHDEQKARRTLGKDVYPWPVAFADALPGMPRCAGMALGIDRLVMLLCDTDNIEDVMAFSER